MIAIAGDPHVELQFGDEYSQIVQSIHHGTVTAICRHGAAITHDALCHLGNSDSPVFDPESKNVIGVVQSGF